MNYRKSEAKEAARAQFRGVWAAITTPFLPDYRVDEAGLRHNMRHLTDNLKIDGVFCTGMMGEFWSLTKEERKRIVEIVVEEAKGKCKVIAHTCHHSAHETIDLTLHAQRVGADFAILANPYFPPMGEDVVFQWFDYIASHVDIGVWMFDVEYTGHVLSPELTARIAGIENVCGIKVSRPIEHYAKLQKLCGDKIVLSNPQEDDFMKMMREYGQKVYMSSQRPYLYQTAGWTPFRDYTELALAGKWEEAEKVSRLLDPLRVVQKKWCRRSHWDEKKIIAIAYIKAWSELMGMAAGPVRPGLPQISAEERAGMKADIERTGLLARIPIARAA